MPGILLGNGIVKANRTLALAPLAPTVAIGSIATRLTLTFNQALNESSIPSTTAFSISGKTISSVTISGTVVTINVTVGFGYSDSTVSVIYTRPGTNPIKTIVGNMTVSSFTASNSIWNTQYYTAATAMGAKATGNDIVYQNTAIKSLVDGGYFAKSELIYIPALHNATDALINFKNPGTYNLTKNSTPAFEQYKGYTGSNTLSKWLNMNFIPSTNATLISQNNICAIIGIGTDVNENFYDFGVSGSTYNTAIRTRYSGNTNYICNASGSTNVANANSIAHFAVSRNVAATYDSYINKVKTVITRASTGLPTLEMVLCGVNNNGTKIGSNKQIRYFILCSYLTPTEVGAVMDIMESYLDNYSAGLIT